MLASCLVVWFVLLLHVAQAGAGFANVTEDGTAVTASATRAAFCSAGCWYQGFVCGRRALLQLNYVLIPLICVSGFVWCVWCSACRHRICTTYGPGAQGSHRRALDPLVLVMDGYETKPLCTRGGQTDRLLLLSTMWFRGLNSGYQAWWFVLLPSELSCSDPQILNG